MMSCRTKTKVIEKTKTETQTEITTEKKEKKIESSEQKILEEKTNREENSEKSENQLIDISAKATTDKPFAFTFKDGYNFKTFTVTGEAEVRFQSNSEQTTNKSEKSENRVQESKQLTALDYFKKIDSTASKKAKTENSEMKVWKADTTAGAYIIIGISIFILITLYFVYRYLKK